MKMSTFLWCRDRANNVPKLFSYIYKRRQHRKSLSLWRSRMSWVLVITIHLCRVSWPEMITARHYGNHHYDKRTIQRPLAAAISTLTEGASKHHHCNSASQPPPLIAPWDTKARIHSSPKSHEVIWLWPQPRIPFWKNSTDFTIHHNNYNGMNFK